MGKKCRESISANWLVKSKIFFCIQILTPDTHNTIMGKKLKGRQGYKAARGKGKGSLVHAAKLHRKMNNERQNLASKKRKLDKTKMVEKMERRKKNAFVPYTSDDTILLVGEGNFSFARALVRRFQGLATRLVATSYDTEEEVLSKYPEFPEILAELQTAGVSVVYGVDCTRLETCTPLRVAIETMLMTCGGSSGGSSSGGGGETSGSGVSSSSSGGGSSSSGGGSSSELIVEEEVEEEEEEESLSTKTSPLAVFDQIVFNFPHTACGIKDTVENNKVHQRLLSAFFHSAYHLLKPVDARAGTVHSSSLFFSLLPSWLTVILKERNNKIYVADRCSLRFFFILFFFFLFFFF